MIMTKHPQDQDPPPDGEPMFEPGQLVRHKRYGYRGVVVDVDPNCSASDDWYFNNKTQPRRDQPWYHVLVHGSSSTTYPAQESLETDDSGVPVDHPLIDHFFADFADGRYRRNDQGWIA